jgi:hypothetical protein
MARRTARRAVATSSRRSVACSAISVSLGAPPQSLRQLALGGDHAPLALGEAGRDALEHGVRRTDLGRARVGAGVSTPVSLAAVGA